MIHIIIEGNSGQIRIGADTFDLLSDEDLETLRKIANKLKKEQMRHLEKDACCPAAVKGGRHNMDFKERTLAR